MGFRIKSKYVLNNGSLMPECTFESSDDPFLKNRTLNKLSIQADRIRFSNIYNIVEQKLSIINEEDGKSETFSIPRGKYTTKRLDELLNSFTVQIQFEFQEDKSKTGGTIFIHNKTDDVDFLIQIDKNLLLITGLLDHLNMSKNTSECFLPLPRGFSHKGHFDLTRSLKEIKLYSKCLFNFKTEICFKSMTMKDLECFLENERPYGNYFSTSVLSSKQLKTDRCDIENASFYFLDFFDQPVFFDLLEIIVFYSN